MKKILFPIVIAGFFSSCQQVAGWFGSNSGTDSTEQSLRSESADKAKRVRDESITKENAYSDLFLDSAALESFIQKEKLATGRADRMREFYLVRNNQFAWFTSGGATEQARGLWSLYASEDKKKGSGPAVRLEERMDSLLTNDSAQFSALDTTLVQTELALTAQLVHLAEENKGLVTADISTGWCPAKR